MRQLAASLRCTGRMVSLGAVGTGNPRQRLPVTVTLRWHTDVPRSFLVLRTQLLRSWAARGIKIWIEPALADDAEIELRWCELLTKHGTITAHELRHIAGLPGDERFDNMIVGGKNMQTTNAIEAGIPAIVRETMAADQADSISINSRPATGNS